MLLLSPYLMMRRLALSWSRRSLHPRRAIHSHFVNAAKSEDDKLHVEWRDGQLSRFHHEFLYDHCRCEQCFHPETRQRLKMLSHAPGIGEVSVTEDGIAISWLNGHKSQFPHHALYKASYDPPLQSVSRRPLETANIDSPPEVLYDDVMINEAGVLEWLNKVDRFGFCYVKGVPANAIDTESLIRRIAHIRETHYGGFWDFTADMSHGDLAYSNFSLAAHTDTTYFTDPAGLQIFHLLCHLGEGGSSLLVDGFAAARKLNPESYRTLSRLAVPAHASGSQGQLLRPHEGPILRHNARGHLIQVCWNNEDRGVLGQGWTPDDIADWYRSAREYEGLLRQHEYWVQLEPGTVVVIDNWRVLHGRAGFTGARRMCGAYIGRDDWQSRRQSLQANGSDLWDHGW